MDKLPNQYINPKTKRACSVYKKDNQHYRMLKNNKPLLIEDFDKWIKADDYKPPKKKRPLKYTKRVMKRYQTVYNAVLSAYEEESGETVTNYDRAGWEKLIDDLESGNVVVKFGKVE